MLLLFEISKGYGLNIHTYFWFYLDMPTTTIDTNLFWYIPEYRAIFPSLYSGISTNNLRKFDIVYSHPLILHRNVTNTFRFRCLTADQKPVNLLEQNIDSIKFHVIDMTQYRLLLETDATIDLALTGIVSVSIPPSDLEDLIPQKCLITLHAILDSGARIPIYIGASSQQGKLDAEIVDSYYPIDQTPVNSTLTEITPDTIIGSSYQTLSNMVSVRMDFDSFVGDVILQGSTTELEWYDIETWQYAEPNSISINFDVLEQVHPYLRVKFIKQSGHILTVSYTE